uniref:Uncharacterized protein n=1 Tax=Coccolithus braarudii TaxID=221442 RepID=A0A7S0L3C4_9EUKA
MPPSAPSHPPQPRIPSPSAAPGRWAPETQPEPVHYPNRARTQQWGVKAHVGKQGTGNAARQGKKATRQEWFSGWLYAATRDEVLLKQQECINNHHFSNRTHCDDALWRKQQALGLADGGACVYCMLQNASVIRHLVGTQLNTRL